MKRIMLTIFFFIAVFLNTFPIGVDVDEIKSTAGEKIEFINYEGENPQFTAEEIRSWGEKIARDLTEGKSIGKYYNFFSLIHIIDPSEKGKFDSDILSISKFGGVNHIDTLRLILQGFFEEQYGFNREDSKLLAYFLTIYNAIHRGDINYFNSRYKKKVITYINENDAGLSTHYKEWPGATKILIPLSEGALKGKISSLDTTELTEKSTIDAIKKEERHGIDEREDMIDLQERQIEEEKIDIEEDREKIEKNKKELEEKKDQLSEDKEKIQKDKENLKKIEDEEKREKEDKKIKEEEEKIKQEEDKIKNQEDKIKEDEEKIKETEEKIEDKEEKIEEDKEELEKDKIREEIEKDPDKFVEKYYEEITEKDEKIYHGLFYYLKVKEYLTGGHYNNEMYIIDAPTGDIVATATNSNICGKEYDIWSDKGVLVITHSGSHAAGHYLTLLDLKTLELIATGKENIFHRSFVEIVNNHSYAVNIVDNNYYLAKFNADMKLVARSKDQVDPNTFISFYKDRIYVNSLKRDILALNSSDLSTIETISP